MWIVVLLVLLGLVAAAGSIRQAAGAGYVPSRTVPMMGALGEPWQYTAMSRRPQSEGEPWKYGYVVARPRTGETYDAFGFATSEEARADAQLRIGIPPGPGVKLSPGVSPASTGFSDQ